MSATRKLRALAGLVLLAGCTVSPPAPPASPPLPALPAMKMPPGTPAPPSRRDNVSVARDFMQLAFRLENGRALPVLSRFEGPITLRLTGLPPSAAGMRDLERLLARLRNEARIPIRRVGAETAAAITVEIVPRAAMRRVAPDAACFVSPGVSSWRAFRRPAAGAGPRDWAALSRRTRLAVFIPSGIAPQEFRDCLHEEIAQALGPVNDLYHLKDSVFNDDNYHAVLTGFDMLILRAFYDPELRSGMRPEQVAARLPGILARINPAGTRRRPTTPPEPTPQEWIAQIEAALGSRRLPEAARLAAARRAVVLARALGRADNRLAFSLHAYGRLAINRDSPAALAALTEAEAIFRSDPATRLHAAHVAVQRAAHALSAGRFARSLRIVDANSPLALQAGNAELLATLLLIKAEALAALGRRADARTVRLDALGWARYGIGDPARIARRQSDIAALVPPTGGSGTGRMPQCSRSSPPCSVPPSAPGRRSAAREAGPTWPSMQRHMR